MSGWPGDPKAAPQASDNGMDANGFTTVKFEEGGQQQSGSQTGERSANGATSTSNGQDAAQQKRANRYKSPLPTGVPLPLPEHESLHTYVQRARNISMFSIAFTLLCAIVGLVFAWSTNSSALLGYGLESLVDVWSSILVLWRFWGDPEGEGSYFLVTRRREARASVGIAVTFVIIGYITCWQAVVHVIEKTKPDKNEILLAIAGTSVIILTWSCAIKWSLAKVLSSSALRKDAITSGAVAAMAATMLVSTAIYKSHPNVWWLDSAVALAVSFILSLLGIKTLVTHSWWRKDFWVDGEATAEEAQAQDIMRNPFRRQKHGTGVENYMAEVQMQPMDDAGAAHHEAQHRTAADRDMQAVDLGSPVGAAANAGGDSGVAESSANGAQTQNGAYDYEVGAQQGPSV